MTFGTPIHRYGSTESREVPKACNVTLSFRSIQRKRCRTAPSDSGFRASHLRHGWPHSSAGPKVMFLYDTLTTPGHWVGVPTRCIQLQRKVVIQFPGPVFLIAQFSPSTPHARDFGSPRIPGGPCKPVKAPACPSQNASLGRVIETFEEDLPALMGRLYPRTIPGTLRVITH